MRVVSAIEMTTKQIIRMLKRNQGKRSITRYAIDMGISPSYLSYVYQRKREPGPKILRAIGLKVIVVGKRIPA